MRSPDSGAPLRTEHAIVCTVARPQVAFDALAAGMLVTILLDTWRIAFGGIVDSNKARAGLTWAA